MTAQFIAEGDSLTFGTGSTGGNTYPKQLRDLYLGGKDYAWSNSGFPGDSVASLVARASTTDARILAGRKSLLLVWIGINDLNGAATAQQTYDALAAYCTARRVAGHKVVVATLIDTVQATANGKRPAFNTLLRAGWATFADGMVDLAADARLSDHTDTTYFDVDGTHLTNTGYGVVAALEKPVTDLLL